MKKDNAILIGVGVAIAGFFGYRYYQRKRDEKAAKEKEAEEAKKAVTPAPTTGGVSSQPVGFTPYQKKVMALQTKLGIAVDGNPGKGEGSQTNMTVKSWFPTLYASLGNVSPANVDQYIAAKKEVAAKATPNTLPNIFAAMKQKTFGKIIKDTKVAAYYYDSASKQYKPTGGYFNIKQGETVYYSGSVLTGAGIARSLPTYTDDGSPAGNKLVMIKANMIYVP